MKIEVINASSKTPFEDAYKKAFNAKEVFCHSWLVIVDGVQYRIHDSIARFSFIMFYLYKQKLRPFTFEIDDEKDRISIPYFNS